MGVVHRSTTRTTFEQRYQIHRYLSKQLLHKSFKMSAAPVKVKSQYADVNTDLTLTIQNGLHDISTCSTFLTLTKTEKLVLMNWSSKQTQKYAKQLKRHRNKRKDNKNA